MKKFDAMRKEFEADVIFNFKPEIVFPQLCPTREYDWIKDWDCELVFSHSGFAEENCVFQTDKPIFGNETWIFVNYQLNKGFDAIRFGEDMLIRWNFNLTPFENGKTLFKSKFQITALCENGNKALENIGLETINSLLNGIERKLNHFLETGKMLDE